MQTNYENLSVAKLYLAVEISKKVKGAGWSAREMADRLGIIEPVAQQILHKRDLDVVLLEVLLRAAEAVEADVDVFIGKLDGPRAVYRAESAPGVPLDPSGKMLAGKPGDGSVVDFAAAFREARGKILRSVDPEI